MPIDDEGGGGILDESGSPVLDESPVSSTTLAVLTATDGPVTILTAGTTP